MHQYLHQTYTLGLLMLSGLVYAVEEEGVLGDIVVQAAYTGAQDEVVDAEEMRLKQAQTVGELLRQVPGVQSGHPSALGQRFSIRGLDDRYVNVIINGARQEGYHFHHSGSYGVSPDLLKRIDVSVGSNSITYDAGALGGGIRFETMNADDLLAEGEAFGAKAKTGWASNGREWQKSLTLYGRADQLDLLGFVNHRSMSDAKTGATKGEATRIPNDGHLVQYLLNTRFNFTPTQYLNVLAERYRNTAETNTLLNFGPMAFQGTPRQYAINRDTYTVSYGFDDVDRDLLNLKVEGYGTKQTSTHLKALDGSDGHETIISTKGVRLRNQSGFETGLMAHALIMGFEYYDSKALRHKTPHKRIEIERSQASAIYVEDQVRVHQWTITPGLRWDRYRYDSMNGEMGPDQVLSADAQSFVKTYTHVAKALGVKYHFMPDTLAFANYTELFRGPSGKEVSMAYSRHSPSLRPTTGHNVELGFSSGFGFRQADDARLTLKGFRTTYEDFVTSQVGRRLDNIPKASLRGLELSFQHEIGPWTTSVGYAKVKNRVVTGNEQFYDGLAFMPPVGDTLTVGLQREVPKHGLTWGWHTRLVKGNNSLGYYGRGGGQIQQVAKPGYGVSDVSVLWLPRAGWLKGTEITMGVDNVFHKAYSDHSYYLNGMPGQAEKGRNLKATLAYAF